HLAISLQKYRLKDMFNLTGGEDYDIIGEPTSVNSARQLARDNRYQFQWWALSLVKAKPVGGERGSKKGKKGKDRGIDGVISFIDDPQGRPSNSVVQIKSGHVKSGDIRDLIGTVENEKAAIGVFITLEQPSEDMKVAAIAAGFYTSEIWGQKYPKIQILTVEDLLTGAQIQMPPSGYGTFKQAPKVKRDEGKQVELDL
ncbi:MAG TPA: restriction endonuclease, partial [Candidatus Brocadiales bacterium]|nr:restriction endonuclease [Candidatus Brocadiales bacterium]